MSEQKPSALDAIMQQFNDSKVKKSDKPKLSSEDRLKNYFTTYLPDKETTGIKRVRILPDINGGSPFEIINVHSAKVEKWEKFLCLESHKGEPCPFCQARKVLLAKEAEDETGQMVPKTASQLARDKETAKKYNVKEMYVVRVIDRDKEEEGVKIWRFWKNYKGQGTYDKILALFKLKGDISSPLNDSGRDLVLQLDKNSDNITNVTSVMQDDLSPLSSDAQLSAKWLAEPKTWKDVYSFKSFDYLAIIVTGGVPVWNSESKNYVDKNTVNASNTNTKNIKNVNDAEVSMNEVLANMKEAKNSADEAEDDMPF